MKEKEFSYIDICDSIFRINPVSLYEVEEAIDKLKNKISKCHYGMTNKFVKGIKEEIAPVLMNTINKSIVDSEFPTTLKTAKVIALHKGGSKDDMNNYRPLSIVSPLSKVIETTVCKQINRFLKINKILYKHQYGFRKNMNTQAAIRTCVDMIERNKENKNITAVIAVDLRKAFDSVNIEILLLKLRKIGFSNNAVKWMRSYLLNRRQYVQITKNQQNFKSDEILIKGGVQQGANLGPLLFLLYNNDLRKYIDKKLINSIITSFLLLILFADDILFIISNKNLQKLEEEAFLILNLVNQWCELNEVEINYTKSLFMLVNCNLNTVHNFNILITDREIEEVKTLKYLGVLLDINLNFKSHVENFIKKLNSAIFIMRYMAAFCGNELLLTIYHALFLSHINYCLNTWSNCSDKMIQRVFLLQKKAVRIIFKLKSRATCREVFQENELLTIPAIIILSRVLDFNLKRLELSKVATNYHQYNTRNKETTKAREESAYYQKAAILFDKLPRALKNEANQLTKFKNELKKYLAIKCPYSISEFIEM